MAKSLANNLLQQSTRFLSVCSSGCNGLRLFALTNTLSNFHKLKQMLQHGGNKPKRWQINGRICLLKASKFEHFVCDDRPNCETHELSE